MVGLEVCGIHFVAVGDLLTIGHALSRALVCDDRILHEPVEIPQRVEVLDAVVVGGAHCWMM